MKNKIIKPKIIHTSYFINDDFEYSIDNKEFDQNNIINLDSITLNSCIFNNVDFSNIDFSNIELLDCIFNNCDLSNKSFDKNGIIRCIFNNCKLLGISFDNASLKNIIFNNCILRYSNFYESKLENILFNETNLDEGYFQELNIKNIILDKCFLKKFSFLNTKHEIIDLSNCIIDNINFDLISLKNSLGQLPELKVVLSKCNSKMLKILSKELDELKDVYNLIEASIVEEPPISVKEGGLIKIGYNEEIDQYKTATTDGKKWIVELEAKEKEETGIKNLKVGYNKVFGYYFEVTKSYLSQVPDRYIRKQTLTGAERYITEELKDLEEKTVGAQEKLVDLEYNVFQEIRASIANQIQRIQKTANVVSTLDVLTSFATVALDLNYCMPIVDNSGEINIKEGRHPVIEKMLPAGSFIENDTYLNKESDRLSIITGPNMAGKSTYMRQVALVTLMAQIGSFVPASYAKIGVVDKIFTRVGASDDLSMGQSTFMVEMIEVANILKDATNNSLVILDEIGRGTSTYDGLSIAWAVAEYIANKEKCGAKTLFATHYHELTDLENKIEGVKNYSIAVKEKGEDIIFLRKIVEGGTDESYGIHVAKLAGVPQDVVKSANEILKGLERKSVLINKGKPKEDKKQVSGQLDMYNYKLADIAHELDKINVNELTPIDAMNILVKLKEAAS